MSQQHYFCPCCVSTNVFYNYCAVFKHIRNEHRNESFFNIRCELSPSCGSRYSSFDSFRRHIYRCHRSLIDPFDNNDTTLSNTDDIANDLENLLYDSSFTNQSDPITDPESCIYPDKELNDMDREFLNFDPNVSSGDDQLNFQKLARFYTHFLLQLREYHLLPQNVVQSISSDIYNLFEIIVELIKLKVSSTMVSINDLETTFTNVTRIIHSISKNEYTFLKQCEKYFNYQAPHEIILKPNEQPAYYIPIKQSLYNMFHSGELLQVIRDNVESLAIRAAKDPDLILSNRQSRTVMSNISNQKNSNTLLLKLYTDGIAITNPIGPKKDFHKFTCFYYMMDDLPDVIRSQVNAISLYCMAYTKHLDDKISRNILMNILVNDLNELINEGFTVPCLSSRVYFVFSSLCGDNLASNEVGGFQKRFNSGNFCRHCLITYEQRHIPLTNISFVPRSRLRHDMIINHIMRNNNGQHFQGVNDYSWFKDLIGFHPTESLPLDIMHDTAEGNTFKHSMRVTFSSNLLSSFVLVRLTKIT